MSTTLKVFIAGVWLCPLLMTDVSAQVKSRGELGVSARAFYPDGSEDNQDYGLTLKSRLEIKGKRGPLRARIQLEGRVGALDNDRSAAILQDAWVGYRGKLIELKLGLEVLNWTATEAFHPADIINSRDLDGSLENPEKIGEPLVSGRLRFLQGGLTVFYFPLRVEPRVPGPRSRLSFAPGQRLSKTLWIDESGDVVGDRYAHQFGARLDQTFGGADVAVHYVRHTDRGLPAILLDPTDGDVHPVLGHVERLGLTYTHAIDEWLLKLEVDHRWFATTRTNSLSVLRGLPNDHTAIAAGVEWGWGYDSGSEGTVIVEGQTAVAPGTSAEERLSFGPFQRDVLLGYRHTLNDVNSTELNLGVIADVEHLGELIANLSLGRRLADVWGLSGSVRLIRAPNSDSVLNPLDGDHSVQVDLTRYF